jgi:tape measure domain-containing protein
MADYVLSAKITGNATDFQKAFQTAQNSLTAFEKRFSSIGSRISSAGSKLTSGITKPAIAATGALAAIPLVKGFDRLVGIDTARSKLQALGHDAESVEAIMDSALTSVQGTAFGLDEAATVAANAVAAGIKPGQDLTKYLTMTADAAAIAGISMQEMGSIINKVQTGQTVYTEDLEQLADRGLPVYQWIAEEAGVAASEVKKLASEGQISSQMLYDAINKNIGGAAQIMGETSFTAAVDNIGASLARIGANFLDAGGQGGGFFSQLKPLMAEFNENLGTIEAKASELGVKFGEAFANMVDNVKSFIASFRALPDWLQSAITNVAAFGAIFLVSLGPVLKIIGSITTGVGKMVKTFNTIKSAGTAVTSFVSDIQTVRAAFNGMAGPLTAEQQKIANFATSAQNNFKKVSTAASGLKGNIAKSFSGLGTTFSGLGTTISGFGTSLAATAKGAGTSLMTMGGAMKGAIAPFLPAIAIIGALAAAIMYLWKTDDSFRESMISSWEQIKASFEPVLQSMSTLITQVVQAIMPAIQQLAQAFGQLIPAITPIITLLAGSFAQILVVVVQVIGQVVQALAPLITSLVSQLAPIITQIVTSLAPIISQLVSVLAPILTAIGNIITTYIMPAITTIVGIVANVINTIIQIVTPIITFIANVVGNIISVIASIISTVSSVFNKIYSVVSSIMGKVRSFIVNVFNKIKSAWNGLTSFVSGIFNGIAGAVQSLVDKVKGFVNGVIGGINAAIGLINKIPGVSISKIPKLAHGTDNWQGGFAVMNEGGRGELTYLPNGSQVIPHDISVKYAKESARANAAAEPLDVYALGAYIVDAVTSQGAQIADGLERGVSKIKMVPDDRNMARYIGKLGFERG